LFSGYLRHTNGLECCYFTRKRAAVVAAASPIVVAAAAVVAEVATFKPYENKFIQ